MVLCSKYHWTSKMCVRISFIVQLRSTYCFSAMSIIYHNMRTFKSCPSQPVRQNDRLVARAIGGFAPCAPDNPLRHHLSQPKSHHHPKAGGLPTSLSSIPLWVSICICLDPFFFFLSPRCGPAITMQVRYSPHKMMRLNYYPRLDPTR